MATIMSQFHVPEVEIPETTGPDVRVGQLLAQPVEQRRVAIVGFPQPDCPTAPDEVRQELYRLGVGGTEGLGTLLGETEDLGNLVLRGQLEEDQELLGKTLAQLLQEGTIPIVLGGGAGCAFGHFLGYVKGGKRCATLRWGPSSSLELERIASDPSRICQLLELLGVAPHLASTKLPPRVLWKGELTEGRIDEAYAPTAFPMMVSMDLGTLDQSLAPGVKRPNPDGMDRALWLYAARRAGETHAVSSLDLVNLCPAHDVEGCTARLAALTLWSFLEGVSRRFQGRS